MTQFKALKLQEKLKSKIYVDTFEKLFYLSDNRLKNTVWFGPMEAYHNTESQQCMIKKQFGPKVSGLIKNMRFKYGKKLQVKKHSQSRYNNFLQPLHFCFCSSPSWKGPKQNADIGYEA